MSPADTSQQYFERMYLENSDPWNFSASSYERERYAAILKAVSHRHYDDAFEPGCSIGILTSQLATVCRRIVAIEISPTAVAVARARLTPFPRVQINVGTLPQDMPAEKFDLIVFSEIGYYFEQEKLRSLGSLLVEHLRSQGTLLAAHWLGSSPDHVLSGDCVHETIHSLSGLTHELAERHDGFRLDRWERK